MFIISWEEKNQQQNIERIRIIKGPMQKVGLHSWQRYPANICFL